MGKWVLSLRGNSFELIIIRSLHPVNSRRRTFSIRSCRSRVPPLEVPLTIKFQISNHNSKRLPCQHCKSSYRITTNTSNLLSYLVHFVTAITSVTPTAFSYPLTFRCPSRPKRLVCERTPLQRHTGDEVHFISYHYSPLFRTSF